MTECQITMWSEPMFPGQGASPMIGRAKCSTHSYSFDGPAEGSCPIGKLEEKLDQMESALQAIAFAQPICLKGGRLAAKEKAK